MATATALARASCQHPAFFRDLCVSCGVHASKTQRAAEEEQAGGTGGGRSQVILSGGNAISLSAKEAMEMKGGCCERNCSCMYHRCSIA
jgi:hypothetical protein